MNSVKKFWYRNILKKNLVNVTGKANTKFFQVNGEDVFEYDCIEDNLAFKTAMTLPNDRIKKVTHNKVLSALSTRNLITINKKKGLMPGKEAKSQYINYNEKTYIFAYDENFVLNLYEI